MDNLLKLKAVLAAVAAVIAASAQAQPAANAQLMAPAPIETASAADIAGLLEPMKIAVLPFEDGDNSAHTIIATTESGGQFLITLFGCADPVAGVGCEGVSSYAGFSNAGLAYDDLNRFNRESTVSKAINVDGQNAVIFGVQQFLKGGVRRDNIQFTIALFLSDLDKYLESAANNQTSVSFTIDKPELSVSKSDNLFRERRATQSAVFGLFSIDGAIASAINNTSDVRFSAPSQP